MQLVWTATRAALSPARLADRRDRVERRLHAPPVMHVGLCARHREGNAPGVDHNMALRARYCLPAAIRRIRPGLFAPFLADALAESAEARDQSRLSASARRCTCTVCRCSHTPACCQSRRRRQQVIPLPQPSSRGSNSQAIPLLSTNRIPVNATRSLVRDRSPLGLGRALESSSATTAHNSSLTSGLLLPPVFHPSC